MGFGEESALIRGAGVRAGSEGITRISLGLAPTFLGNFTVLSTETSSTAVKLAAAGCFLRRGAGTGDEFIGTRGRRGSVWPLSWSVLRMATSEGSGLDVFLVKAVGAEVTESESSTVKSITEASDFGIRGGQCPL